MGLMAQPILGPKWETLKTNLWPGETHGVSSDCPNPYCNYDLTPQDYEDAEMHGGDFECPNCGWTFNVGADLWGDDQSQRDRTRAGMTPAEMGKIGEDSVKQWAKESGEIPGVGQILWESPDYNDPIDLVAGDFAIEVKSLHSESFPRYKIAADPGSGARRADVIKGKINRMNQLAQHLGKPLYPAMIGVRLNFYTNRADFFFQTEYKDRLMTAMQHIGSTDFSSLNPFKRPEDITKQAFPAQGETMDDSDIPF
jgi:hypothetical protein